MFLLSLPFLMQLFMYLHEVVILVIWIGITLLVYFIVCFVRNEKMVVSLYIIFLLLIVYSASLGLLLFNRPTEQYYGNFNLIPFSTIQFYFSGKVNPFISFYNLAANVCLTIPFGLFLMIRREKHNLSVLNIIFSPLIFISIIEVLQYFSHRGNLDIDDLILNFTGVLIGFLIYPVFKRVVQIK